MNEQQGQGPTPETGQGPTPETDAEMRERLEEELSKVRVEDVVLQSVVSIVNLTARRIAKEDERDLAQAKLGIDAVRALVELLPEEAAKQIRGALSELQMLYAREAGEAGEGAAEGPGEGAAERPRPSEGERAERPPSAAERASRLWTPPGT